MSANKIAETSTSVGTGDFTLAGAWSIADSFVTGNRTFNSFYGVNHFFPYMIQDKSGNWEKGVGYLSGASTLVRETVTDNSLSTAALINFPAGDKLVMVPTDAGADWSMSLGAGYIQSAHQHGQSGGTAGIMANFIYLQPFLLKRPTIVEGLAMEVTTAVTSTSVRFALYSAKDYALSNVNLAKVTTDGAIDTTTNGWKDASIDGKLSAGFYVLAMASLGGTPTMRLNTTAQMDFGIYQSVVTSTSNMFIQSSPGAGSGLPSTITGAVNAQNASAFRAHVRGRFL